MDLFNVIDKLVSTKYGGMPRYRSVMGECLALITLMFPEACSELNENGQCSIEELISDLNIASEACVKGVSSSKTVVPFVCDVTIPILCSYCQSHWTSAAIDTPLPMEYDMDEVVAICEDIIRNVMKMVSSDLEQERKVKIVNSSRVVTRKLSLGFVVNEVFVCICKKVTYLYHTVLSDISKPNLSVEEHKRLTKLKKDIIPRTRPLFFLAKQIFQTQL